MTTIFALATPAGKSGVAIIRVSGKDAIFAAKKLTNSNNFEHKKCIFTDVINSNGEIIDHGLVIYFKGPNSFTGEDVVEFQLHGSIAVIKVMIKELGELDNFRYAEAGEFSKRAFINNKLDLTQAEGLEDLINAETSLQLRQAINQLDGKFQNLIWIWREKIIEIMAYIEAYIDFPDEDIPEEIILTISTSIKNLILTINNYMNDGQAGELIRSGIYIAISGKPNVGKSSLINYFAGRDVAIVSHIAGTTRDIIETTIDIDGIPVIFADTAGIRESTDEIERIGIEKTLKTISKANLKIALYSAEEYPGHEEIRKLTSEGVICVVNKIDLLTDKENDPNIIAISVQENIGINKLQEKIRERLGFLNNSSSNPFITRTRYREHLNLSVTYLQDFLQNDDIVLAAEDLRMAAREIEKISGKIDVEQILDKIFSSFCIGK